MKLRHLFPELNVIATFGNARLVRNCEGKFELMGGSKDERAQAEEWISLFMHEAVIGQSRPRLGRSVPLLKRECVQR
jgi:hypothetical protein